MEKARFIALLSRDADPTAEETDALSTLVEQYPFFQAARVLRLKGLHQHRKFAYNSALKKTAVHTIDRGILFDYITSEDFKQHHTAEQIQKRETEQRIEDGDLGIDKQEAERVLDPGLFAKKENDQRQPERSASEKAPQKATDAQPVDFDSDEEHSFSEWLKLTKAKPVEREAGEEREEIQGSDQGRHEKIIDEFIATNPKIKPPEKKHTTSDTSTQQGNTDLMTETLAKVYLDQRNYDRAIQSYKILMLKNPEKSGFFADQIRAIEEMKEKN